MLSNLTPRIYITTPNFRVNTTLWFLHISPSGTYKSEFEQKLEDILVALGIYLIPANFSPEALFKDLASHPVSAFIKDEVSGFFESLSKKEYMSGTLEVLSEIFTGKREIQRRTIRQGITVIRNPYVTFWWDGSDSTFAKIKPEFFTQGFLMRFLYLIREKSVPIYLPDQGGTYNHMHYVPLVEFMAQRREWIKANGITEITYERLPAVFHYLVKVINHMKHRKSEKFGKSNFVYQYYNRLHVFVLKIAALLQLCKSLEDQRLRRDENGKVTLLIDEDVLRVATRMTILYEDEFLKFVMYFKDQVQVEPLKLQSNQLVYVMNLLKKTELKIIKSSTLLRRSQMSKTVFYDVIATLVERGEVGKIQLRKELIEQSNWSTVIGGKGRPPVIYYDLKHYTAIAERKKIPVDDVVLETLNKKAHLLE